MSKRVAITGIGGFCGVAKNSLEFAEALVEGRSGIETIDLFDVSSFPSRIGSQVKNFNSLD